MKLGILELTFRLQGCSSLKEKRQRLSGIRKLKKRENLLFFESGHQDTHSLSNWVFVAGASSEISVDQILDKLELLLPTLIDAEVTETKKGDVGL